MKRKIWLAVAILFCTSFLPGCNKKEENLASDTLMAEAGQEEALRNLTSSAMVPSDREASDMATTDITTPDMTTSDMTASDMIIADMTTSDTIISDTEVSDMTASDISETNVTDEVHQHQWTVVWLGDSPSCTVGGYQYLVCEECGYVDETSGQEADALGHLPETIELQHGNCVEDTILLSVCSRCGETLGYERYPEPEEHLWVDKVTEVWDEEAFAFVEVTVRCCQRCNVREAE